PAESPFHYRNKLEYSFASTPSGPALGFHRAGRWDELIAIDHCHIASDRSNEVRQGFERWAGEHGLQVYDQRTGTGFLRHLVVREGVRSGELLALLVTAEGALPDTDGLAAALPQSVVGVLHAVNNGVAEVTHGLPSSLVYGRDWYEERIGGLRLKVSAGAFMQTNTLMSERLYRTAIEFAEITGDDIVWDLYCGAGALGLLAAEAGAGAVYGIEIHPESVERAKENALVNGLPVEFVTGDVARAVRPLLGRAPAPTVALVDPPRAGLTPRAVRRVIELAPRRLVYVSCNPTTLAPNCAQLAGAGYRLDRVQPVDMFPHTPHIECVALLRRELEAAD
ncbi:MAG TPA: 23S rRNA (uracil(1939)-C(5))-methyltransferase RlmD, partial [Gaiellales bacterium]|nr:23S rRNA (uracil(1939)-C(5))-methyltransferase RlmD [Gaiellales bacterium]